jgi:hypothetical protein
MPLFWIDACSLIQANREIFPHDKTPAFWSFLAEHVANGNVCSTKHVYDEILRGRDYLKQWAKSRKKNLCIKPDPRTQVAYRRIADYVRTTYPIKWWDEFLNDGDGWVIASAMALEGKVVTEESSSRTQKIRIPVICETFGVPHTGLEGMLRDLDAPFGEW